MLNKTDVYLVTSDKDFYADNKYEKGLAKNLHEETKNFEFQLTIMPSISELLKDLRQEVLIDEQALVDAVLIEYGSDIHRMLDRNGFSMQGNPSKEVKIFATESSDRLYIEFAIIFYCSDETTKSRTDVSLEVKGDGSYYVISESFDGLRSHGEKLVYKDHNGEKTEQNQVVHVGHAVIGHKSVQHTVRTLLS